MKNVTRFDGMLIAQASVAHPLQSELTFTFTDYSPNANKQGVRKSEAGNLINTGLYMPVKVNYLGTGVGGHSGAVPIGPIIELREDGDRLIGKAVVWRDEFGDVVNYLETASKEDGGVQFSWELYFSSSDKDQNGVEWLNNCVVAGATIVSDPAYGGRTPLLAFAEENKLTAKVAELELLIQQALSELKDLRSASMADVVVDTAVSDDAAPDEIVNSEVVAETGTQEVAATEPEATADPLAALQAELDELRAFKIGVEQREAQAALKVARCASLEGIGVAAVEMSDAQLAFILGMSEDQFAAYLDTTGALIKRSAGKASAETQTESSRVIPDPTVSGTGTNTITTLAQSLRRVRRVEAAS